MKQLIKVGDSLMQYFNNKEDSLHNVGGLYVTKEVRNEVLCSKEQGYITLNNRKIKIMFENVGDDVYWCTLHI